MKYEEIISEHDTLKTSYNNELQERGAAVRSDGVSDFDLLAALRSGGDGPAAASSSASAEQPRILDALHNGVTLDRAIQQYCDNRNETTYFDLHDAIQSAWTAYRDAERGGHAGRYPPFAEEFLVSVTNKVEQEFAKEPVIPWEKPTGFEKMWADFEEVCRFACLDCRAFQSNIPERMRSVCFNRMDALPEPPEGLWPVPKLQIGLTNATLHYESARKSYQAEECLGFAVNAVAIIGKHDPNFKRLEIRTVGNLHNLVLYTPSTSEDDTPMTIDLWRGATGRSYVVPNGYGDSALSAEISPTRSTGARPPPVPPMPVPPTGARPLPVPPTGARPLPVPPTGARPLPVPPTGAGLLPHPRGRRH